MRHFTAIIAALLFLSLTGGGAFAAHKGKKVELTEQELDAVSAAGPIADAIADLRGRIGTPVMETLRLELLGAGGAKPPRLEAIRFQLQDALKALGNGVPVPLHKSK
jgi:hypothetical protein